MVWKDSYFLVFQSVLTALHFKSASSIGYTNIYIGCFLEGTGNEMTLPYNHFSSQNLTNRVCVDHCASFAAVYTYAGTQGGNNCFCGTDAVKDGFEEAQENECSTPCSGNDHRFCGGDFRLSIFHIIFDKPTTTVSPTTTDKRYPVSSMITADKRSAISSVGTEKSSPSFVTTDQRFAPSSEEYTDSPEKVTSIPLSTKLRYFTESVTVETTPNESPTENPILSTSSGPSITNSDGMCVCPCTSTNYYLYINKTIEELIESATKDLGMDKKQTSAYLNSKISASDDRISSRNVGIVGIIVILFPVVLLIVVDCTNGPFSKKCRSQNKNDV